ncbi:hypothetical protein NLJ89_g5534 [Agrocybe chaxingu]|uniref:S-formylglutathione hydrolase n=1 Tax=Agrocybe chaxingu TaxID=84603 RepID=A0A9W8MTI6_9AGAR|nr:hypothetical protein NLJ89_g5534 [Agrocybe chaxingu]
MSGAPALEKLSSNRVFEGELTKYKFKSAALGGLDAQFNLFMPLNPGGAKVPVLVYLAGVPGEDDDWDFGTGAGFYINATKPEYAKNYNMATHITVELPQVIEAAGIAIDWKRQSIFGHSMGGHGALTLYLSSTTKQYRSASAFAPISNPTKCPWGEKAFKGYLEGGLAEGAKYDATELISKATEPLHILVDYGTGDNFYKQGQLLPENFLKTARDAGYDEFQVRVRSQEGYDHSYYFISTFASDHIHFHANFLKA